MTPQSPPPPPFTQDDGILVSSPDGATEHVLLAMDEVPELRERAQPRARQLHDEARKLTNKYAQTDYATVGVQADLTLLWSSWKMYIAVHRYADEIIGPGVVSFTAEFIDGTTDPNRGGNPRLDLVVGHLHGGYTRLHPGAKPKMMLPRGTSPAVLQSMPQVQNMPQTNGVRLPQTGSSHSPAQT